MENVHYPTSTTRRSLSSAPIFAWLLLGIGALTLTLALFIFAARAVGSAQPPPETLAPLHLTDCALPCWMGMTPGKTSFDEAVRRVSAAFPQSQPQITAGRIINLDTPFGQVLITAERDGLIHRITLPSFRLKGVALGDVVGFLGKPTWIVGVNPTAVFYGCQTYQVVVSSGSVAGGWRQHLVIIDIQDSGFSCPDEKHGS